VKGLVLIVGDPRLGQGCARLKVRCIWRLNALQNSIDVDAALTQCRAHGGRRVAFACGQPAAFMLPNEFLWPCGLSFLSICSGRVPKSYVSVCAFRRASLRRPSTKDHEVCVVTCVNSVDRGCPAKDAYRHFQTALRAHQLLDHARKKGGPPLRGGKGGFPRGSVHVHILANSRTSQACAGAPGLPATAVEDSRSLRRRASGFGRTCGPRKPSLTRLHRVDQVVSPDPSSPSAQAHRPWHLKRRSAVTSLPRRISSTSSVGHNYSSISSSRPFSSTFRRNLFGDLLSSSTRDLTASTNRFAMLARYPALLAQNLKGRDISIS